MTDIELVIKIPEVEYEHLANKEKFYSLEKSKQEWLINKTLNRVINCKPLPSGHGRLIDANTVDKSVKNPYQNREVMYWINNAPTVIEANKQESEK